ncbi:MAG: hypothetical protein JWN93_1622 [Hyphomicrobiales bacterium]|nr:hypothetical protein [Hyphomicrobiales bacterium]
MIDRSAFQALVDLGRRKGRLETQDIARYMPVERMDAEDLALVLLELEQAGVEVELDDHLLTRTPARPTSPAPEVAPIDLPGASPRQKDPLTTPVDAGSSFQAASPGLSSAPAARPAATGRLAKIAGGVAGLAALVAVAALVVRALWGS